MNRSVVANADLHAELSHRRRAEMHEEPSSHEDTGGAGAVWRNMQGTHSPSKSRTARPPGQSNEEPVFEDEEGVKYMGTKPKSKLQQTSPRIVRGASFMKPSAWTVSFSQDPARNTMRRLCRNKLLVNTLLNVSDGVRIAPRLTHRVRVVELEQSSTIGWRGLRSRRRMRQRNRPRANLRTAGAARMQLSC